MAVASMICAPLGILTELAVTIAMILPPCMTITPFSMMPCVMVNSLPPFRARGFSWVSAGVDEIKIKTNAQVKGHERRRPLHPCWLAACCWLIDDGGITCPPCNAWFRTPLGHGRSRRRHRSELFLAHR